MKKESTQLHKIWMNHTNCYKKPDINAYALYDSTCIILTCYKIFLKQTKIKLFGLVNVKKQKESYRGVDSVLFCFVLAIVCLVCEECIKHQCKKKNWDFFFVINIQLPNMDLKCLVWWLFGNWMHLWNQHQNKL